MKKDFKEIIRGARCCLNLDGSESCENCPYVAAGENCGHELDKDLLQTAETAEKVTEWSSRALAWLRFQQPDALIAMVDSIGENIPEVLRCRAFGNDQERA